MWLLIIIVVIIFIMWKFSTDKKQLLNETAQLGGMSKRYFTLINILMEGDPECKIFEVTPNSITFGLEISGASTYFTIIQLFNQIVVEWQLNSPIYGVYNRSWKFKEPINQKSVGMQIRSDIEATAISPI